MKATFIGVPGEDHDALYMYGQVFPKGKAVSITSPLGMRKLANHPHFETTAEPKDEVEDVQIKREFSGAVEAALAEKANEPPAPPPAEPAPRPPEPTLAPVRSASEYQDRFEKAPVTVAGHMPETVKSAAEYQELEMSGGIHGNADASATGDADLAQDQGGGPGRSSKPGVPSNSAGKAAGRSLRTSR